MRILYCGNFQQPHCTEVHLAATLEELGHTVIRIQENGGDEFWFDQQLASNAFDMFLFTRTWGETVKLEHLDKLRERGIPSVSYHLDLYVGLKREDGLNNDPFWRTDFVFTPDGDPASAEVFKCKGINHFYMKPGVFKNECYMAQTHGYKHDVVFVGGGTPTGQANQYGHNEWPYRGQLLKWLEDTYGSRYGKYGYPQETIRNAALNQLYADSKVVVGDSLCLNFNHPYYWSDRVYETMGRGGFIIHPYIPGLEEEFTDGENIVFYRYNDWNQLKELVDYYIEHDEERERIRQAGHEHVKEHATYHNRLVQMLDIVNSRKEPNPPKSGELKINLGAGEDQFEGYVNVDFIDLPGIDVVHNLMDFPYPFEDGCATNVKAVDVLEHLDNYTADRRPSVIAFIEECHRILKPGGELFIQTPGYDAEFLWLDVTHVRGFHPQSMDFFDPDTHFGKTTGFYSNAKFKVTAEKLENCNLRFTMVKR